MATDWLTNDVGALLECLRVLARPVVCVLLSWLFGDLPAGSSTGPDVDGHVELGCDEGWIYFVQGACVSAVITVAVTLAIVERWQGDDD